LNAHTTRASEPSQATGEHVQPERLNGGESREVEHQLAGVRLRASEHLQRTAGRRAIDLAFKDDDVLAARVACANPQARRHVGLLPAFSGR